MIIWMPFFYFVCVNPFCMTSAEMNCGTLEKAEIELKTWKEKMAGACYLKIYFKLMESCGGGRKKPGRKGVSRIAFEGSRMPAMPVLAANGNVRR
ncbi:hypothetical protein [Azospirillum isscasi]|uniref:Secreted protein n=1 Tax=Azospirillum isscasi TaxID=3053926 RepID=A0ABU0WFU6_9PROT|nr:hypothetical protein [Azospirillum isscasi]MDQ2102923.1 hypothetical protein [Azospirillum isscasi]